MPWVRPPEELTYPAETSSTGSLVRDRFTESTDLAEELWALARQIINQLAEMLEIDDWEIPIFTERDMMGLDSLELNDPVLDSLRNIVMETVTMVGTPPTPNEYTPEYGRMPEKNFEKPVISMPDPPDVTWPILEGEAPGIRDPYIEPAPDDELPPVPSIREVTIPNPPTFTEWTFDGEEPSIDLTPPENMYYYNEEAYTSPVLTRLKSWLEDQLTLLGTPDETITEAEQALYDRAEYRLDTKFQEIWDNTVVKWEGRGYPLIPGELEKDVFEDYITKRMAEETDLNNAIIIEQNKIYQEKIHAVVKEATALETLLVSYTNEFQNRALQSAQFVVTSAIEIYKAKITGYNAQLLRYKTQADVYTTLMQGELIKAQYYMAQVEAAKLNVQVQKLYLDAYMAQLAGIQAKWGLWKTKIEAAALIVEVDKAKVQAWMGKVQAYAEEMRGIVARYNAYQAQIAGEAEKARVFETEVKAFGEEVRAYGTEVSAKTEILRGKLEDKRNQTEVFRARIAEFDARVKKAIAKANVDSQYNTNLIQKFQAQTGALEAKARAVSSAYATSVQEQQAISAAYIARADMVMREFTAKVNAAIERMRAAGQITSQMASAAISTISASASLGFQESRSDSRSFANSNQAMSQYTEMIQAINQWIYNVEV
jgi:hypothetical protein